MQLGPRQANRAPHLAARLRDAGEDMLDAGVWVGDAPVTALLRFGLRLIFAAFALDVHAVAFADLTATGDVAMAGQLPVC